MSQSLIFHAYYTSLRHSCVWICLCLLATSTHAALYAPLNLGKRGSEKLAPENTLTSFDIALTSGAHGIEVDVQMSVDGIPFAMHDSDLDRTTNGTGIAKKQTMEYLKTLDAGSWFHPAFAGEPIPTFREVVQLVNGRGGIYLDIKQANMVQTMSQILAEENFRQDHVIGIAHNAAEVLELQTYMPDTVIFYRISPAIIPETVTAEWIQSYKDLGAIGFAGNWVDIEPWMDIANENDMKIIPYNTGNTPREYLHAIDRGVFGIAAPRPYNMTDVVPDIPGDFNLDGIVNIQDLSKLATHFNKVAPNVLNFDVNNDNLINIVELSTLATNFGRHAGFPDIIYPRPTMNATNNVNPTNSLLTNNLTLLNTTTIPEPTTAIFFLTFCFLRKRSTQ